MAQVGMDKALTGSLCATQGSDMTASCGRLPNPNKKGALMCPCHQASPLFSSQLNNTCEEGLISQFDGKQSLQEALVTPKVSHGMGMILAN